jgi:hypothetical protein
LEFQKDFSGFFYKIERVAETKGAAGEASVFWNLKRFCGFIYKIQRAVEI